jgi:hypothetical protein
MENRIYTVNQKYIDRRDKKDQEDQFLRWLNTDKTGLWVSFGISGLKYTADKTLDGLCKSTIVLVTTEHENSYPDVIDLESGIIQYWGDNRDKNKKPFEKRGNKIIEKAMYVINNYPTEYHPTILLFDKRNVPSGEIEFRGVCDLKYYEVLNYNYEGEIVQNLLITLQLRKDIESIDVKQLHERLELHESELLNFAQSNDFIFNMPTPLHRSKVEAPLTNNGWTAELFVNEFFIKRGWDSRLVGHLHLGYDIHISKDDKEFLIEVKSSLGNISPTFTENELIVWKENPGKYIVALLENFKPDQENEIVWLNYSKDNLPDFSTSTITNHRLNRSVWIKNHFSLDELI